MGHRGGDGPVPGKDRLRGRSIGGNVGRIGDQTRFELDREPSSNLLAIGGGADQDRNGVRIGRDLRKRFGLRCDEVVHKR
jgi:hypothetical protein